MDRYKMIPYGIVSATTQSSIKVCKLTRIKGSNEGPRINAVGNLMAEVHGIAEALNRLIRSAILPSPSIFNVG
jgi:hypothetical protein